MATLATTFLNVDVEVESRADHDPLVAAMAHGALAIGRYRRGGQHCVRFELNISPRSPDHGIRAFSSLLESLPAPARKLWRAARRRDFDVGVQGSRRSHPEIIELSPETVQLAAKLRGRIVITVYPANGRGRRLTSA